MTSSYFFYLSIISEVPLEQKVAEVKNKDTYVPYEGLPEALCNATVSIEDRRFYKHNGVDVIGVGRAIISQFSSRYAKSGGSTITQQTCKNLYDMFSFNPLNKGCQMFMAWELENIYSKHEILAVYVNIINYGDKHEGIYEASTNYFGVEPMYLSFAQSTLLAGIPQAPSFYQLSTGYENAKVRQLAVLHAMAKEGYLDPAYIEEIYNTPVY